MSSAAIDYARSNYPRFLDELKTLIRIPSVSTLPEHKEDVLAAAQWLAKELTRIGMEHVEVITTPGHPLVYADWLHAPGKPACLCYGHYDVQPPDPLDEWKSPPFDPTERDGNLYARGAVDDKGQMYMHVKALEALFRSNKGKLPINIRLILEGEEEVGGEQIARFIREHPDRLKADFALVSDTEMFAPELPTLCVGLRGMIYTEIEARGAKTDLHSGMYGGAAPNPFVALAQIIAQLKDSAGRILIPGFYDAIKRPSDDELDSLATAPLRRGALPPHRGRVIRASPASPASPSSSAPGRAPRSTSTACPAASPEPAPRPSSQRKPSPKSPCGLSPTRPRRGLRPIQKLCRIPQARRHRARRPPHPLRRPHRHRHRQPLHPGRHARPQEGLGQGNRLHPLRRIHSHRRRFRAPPENPHRHDGLRPARR